MLALLRKDGEAITIGPIQDIEKDISVSELFRSGPITIRILHVHKGSGKVKLGIEAPEGILILREELDTALEG